LTFEREDVGLLVYVKHDVYQQYDRLKKEEIIRNHLPLVYKIARHVANVAVLGILEYNDLVNVGVLGLYKALEKYDESKLASFGAFASHHVKGFMLDELNRTKQVPRSLREKQSKVKVTFEKLGQELLREPRDEEVASYLGIVLEEYHNWLVDIGWTSVWSLDELESAGTLQLVDNDESVDPMAVTDTKDRKMRLVNALRGLSDKEQRLLHLYYEEELTLKEIGYVLDLSESQISRTHSKVILKLKQMLQTDS